ncbi:hypothetical protein HAHE_20170 [Haloferula helveola]|uniref:DinB-like domain-containing protein n=1 Tax=Haloferula helveola TaxID=490095 RepID=A0ABN6H390_9BACT|nr:hypothetical protein HAHE_20170 [Haloferula helveola]
MSVVTEPKLAAPGAGLPAMELMIARIMFGRKRKSGSRDGFDREFHKERELIRKRVASCDPSRRGERVLIKRLRGLEDSSRNWSVWMTLDHLRICNGVFAAVIGGLSRGQVPEKEASTADVKPSPEVGEEIEASYGASCDALLSAVGAVSDLATDERYAHPWFGPLDAAGWHALSALHMGIHRRQIEKIIEGLG